MNRQSEILESVTEQSLAAASMVRGLTSTLTLLRQIETTVDSLCALSRWLKNQCEFAEHTLRRVENLKPTNGKYIDPDDEAIDSMNSAAAAMEKELSKLVMKKSTIDRDGHLRPDQREQLHSAYHEAIEALSYSADTIRSLRAAIIRHDMAAEPRDSSVYDSVKDFVVSLRS
jgi:hypothetical protein